MVNKNLYMLQKYNKELSQLFDNTLKVIECQKKNCTKEYNELDSLKQTFYAKITKLYDDEIKTVTWRNYDKKRKAIVETYHNNEYVKKHLYNIKNNIKSDKETLNNAKKLFAIYQKDHKENMKNYLKTADKKFYEKETKKLFDKLSKNKTNINLTNCGLKQCNKLYKKDLLDVKVLVNKFCKEKMKKSCKISKIIDKIDISKFNAKDSTRIIKIINKGLY